MTVLKRNRNNMPDGFEPPVPAWAADWTGGVTRLSSACFGVQGPEPDAWRRWVFDALQTHRDGPQRLERAVFADKAGVENTVYIGYWRNDDYDGWWQADGVGTWWADDARLGDGAGFWREVFHIAPDRIETLHSSPHAHGIAHLAGELEGPVDEHAYPGAARDRIPASGTDRLQGEPDTTATLVARTSHDGRRVAVVPPRNMCVIRSGQDWGHCTSDERDFYLTEVEPSLRAGMDFLRDNPGESRCLSMRLMRQSTLDGAMLDQTFGLGYGLDIYAFEEWAKSHPTHLRIFDQFMGHAGRFGEEMQLRLWHEVSVITPDAADFEYIACHRDTGLLPYASD